MSSLLLLLFFLEESPGNDEELLLSFFPSTCVMIELVASEIVLLLLLLLLLLLRVLARLRGSLGSLRFWSGAMVVSGMFYASVPVRFFFYEQFDDGHKRKTAVVVTCFWNHVGFETKSVSKPCLFRNHVCYRHVQHAHHSTRSGYATRHLFVLV